MTTENLTVRLFTELYNRSEISFKAREKYALSSEYFREKVKAEDKLIEREEFLKLFLDASEQEIADMILKSEAPHFFTTQVIFEVITDTLKRAIDAHMENDPKIQALRKAYFRTKQNLATETPELLKANPDFITEDGFIDWLDGREQRDLAEEWRNSPNPEGCPNCFSHGSIVPNGNAWRCRKCGRSWRKRYS
jgi:hypothetical protein